MIGAKSRECLHIACEMLKFERIAKIFLWKNIEIHSTPDLLWEDLLMVLTALYVLLCVT